MVFSSGKIIVNGSVSTIAQAKQRLRRYARMIQRFGYSVKLSKIKVVTVSASYKVQGTLDLNKVWYHYGGRYEPELFPASMFSKDCIHFTCFHSGTVLMTGIKRQSQLYNVCLPILVELPLL